jgi:hypothetical protein
MSESLSLGELIAAEHPTFAWPSDWAASTKRLFTTASAGLGQPTLLNSASIEEVLTCPGWWAGQREVDESELSMAGFRDLIYDMLIYNLDVAECIWYILYYFIQNENISDKDTSDILDRCYVFLKYYNNNYRPIYHLESILFYFIAKIYKYERSNR